MLVKVGKRVKSTKIKVQWQITFENEWIIHAVELKHSIVSGKREVYVDGVICAQSKKLLQSVYEHQGRIGDHDLRVTIEDTFEGYLYDLIVDDIPFHQMPKMKIAQLEELRNAKQAPPPTANFKTDFASFTGGSRSLDGSAAAAAAASKRKEPSPPSSPEEGNLLGDLDWATAGDTSVHKSFQVAGMSSSGFNPFEAPPPQQQQTSYMYNNNNPGMGYGYNQPPPPPPVTSSYMNTAAADPFAVPPSHMAAFSGYQQQQPKSYDPFA
jgi:hypothetical protein